MLSTVTGLEALAKHIAARLSFIANWSIMQLENTGFAKNRWGLLYSDRAINWTVEQPASHQDTNSAQSISANAGANRHGHNHTRDTGCVARPQPIGVLWDVELQSRGTRPARERFMQKTGENSVS